MLAHYFLSAAHCCPWHKTASRAFACTLVIVAIAICLLPQNIYAQEPSISEPAYQIAAQYDADPVVVQRMINAGIPTHLIDLAMIQEFSQPAADNGLPSAGSSLPTVIMPAQVLTQEVTLESCGSQNFPFVFLNVSVRNDGEPILDLTQDNFQCSENGFDQTDLFSVTPPQAGGGVRLADIVFLIDTSGSMGDKIAAVRDNVNIFAQSLISSSVDFRLGLVQFGNYSGSNPEVFNAGNLTADVGLFTGFIDTLYADGGYEPGFLALRMAVQEFNFRPGAQKVFLLISDEDSDDYEKQATLDLLLANDVTVHTAVDCSFGNSQGDYCDETSVRGATGGALFAITGPYDQVLDEISSRTASTYVVQYRSSNQNYDGTLRNVVCSVTTPAGTNSVTCSYIPGAEPKIVLTLATLALNAAPLAEGSTPTIEVQVTDVVTPGVQSVTLYYRVSNSNAGYKGILMNLSGTDLYTATVPAVSSPGLDYYIRATDGQVTSQLPSTDPGQRPFQIAVLPNVKPAITHEPIAVAPSGVELGVQANVEDTTNSLVSVELKWKYVNELIYRTVAMTPGAGNQFSATLTKEQVVRDIDYYIVAMDDLGVANSSGSADSPHHITVADYSGMTISLKVADIVHFGENARVTASVVRNGSTQNVVKVGFEVIAGPNQGATDSQGRGFCITIFGWSGPCFTDNTGEILWKYKYDGSKGIGKDEVRAYVDINRNNRYDQGEPVAESSFRWFEHITYVAMGDSYSSGEGLGKYIEGTDKGEDENVCHRSKNAYPRLIAPYPYDDKLVSSKGPTVDFLACSGAKTAHIVGNLDELKLDSEDKANNNKGSGPSNQNEPLQQSSLAITETARGVEMVTISIGGNDTWWPKVVEFCVKEDDCRHAEFKGLELTDWMDARIDRVLSRVRLTLQKLKETSPNASLLLIGYPPMFPEEDDRQTCVWLKPWSPDEQDSLSRALNRLDDGLASIASELGIHFVDPRSKFAGHEVCGKDKEYMPGFQIPLTSSFHPNDKGHYAYKEVLEAYIKEQIEGGAPLNNAGMPLRPVVNLAGLPAQLPVLALSSEQIAAADSVQFTNLDIDPADSLCGSGLGSLSGGTVQVADTGLAPGTIVTLTLQVLDVGEIALTPTVVDPSGSFEITVPLPIVTFDTAYNVMAVGVNLDGDTIIAISDFVQLFADQPPCTTADSAITQLDTPVRIDVLANDNAGAVALDFATLVVRTKPQDGTAYIDITTHSLVYQPNLGFFGEDSITYGICDQSGTCAEGLVSVTVNPGCTINGTEDDDVLTGTGGPDVICGYGGDDVIDGGEGNDVILGGSGHDALYGGPGDDRVFGGTGENVAAGGDGVDLVVPGPSALMSDVSETRSPQNINSLVVVTATAAYHNPTVAPNAPFGTHTITATFTNVSAQSVSNLFFRVTTLTQNNFLINADTGPSGEGAVRSVAPTDLGDNGLLDPGESFTVNFTVGVVSRSSFTFAIDAFGILEGVDGAIVGGDSEGFQFNFAEKDMHFINPLYLPMITR